MRATHRKSDSTIFILESTSISISRRMNLVKKYWNPRMQIESVIGIAIKVLRIIPPSIVNYFPFSWSVVK